MSDPIDSTRPQAATAIDHAARIRALIPAHQPGDGAWTATIRTAMQDMMSLLPATDPKMDLTREHVASAERRLVRLTRLLELDAPDLVWEREVHWMSRHMEWADSILRGLPWAMTAEEREELERSFEIQDDA